MAELPELRIPKPESKYHMLKVCSAAWGGFMAVVAGGFLAHVVHLDSSILPGPDDPGAHRPPLVIAEPQSR